MGFLDRLLFFRKKKEQPEETSELDARKSFLLYVVRLPEIVTYFRREKGIARRNLELVLVDDEERPAYQVVEAAELLITDLNCFYVVTGRPEEFEELGEKAMEEYGLIVIMLEKELAFGLPGNLVLDVRDWEKHLDIVTAVSYNTVII